MDYECFEYYRFGEKYDLRLVSPISVNCQGVANVQIQYKDAVLSA